MLTRLTDKQAKNLANKYRKGQNHSRIQPYEDHGGVYNYHQERYGTTQGKVVDLTYKRSHEQITTALISPKSTRYDCSANQGHPEASEDHVTETDPKNNDVPVAQIVIPSATKIEIQADSNKN